MSCIHYYKQRGSIHYTRRKQSTFITRDLKFRFEKKVEGYRFRGTAALPYSLLHFSTICHQRVVSEFIDVVASYRFYANKVPHHIIYYL